MIIDNLLETKNIVAEKSVKFAIRIIRLHQYLKKEKGEYIMSVQILKSGTSIGANIHEAVQGQSRADFISKMSIALKEVSETDYWLRLLSETDYISYKEYSSLDEDCKEIIKLLTSIIKSTKLT